MPKIFEKMTVELSILFEFILKRKISVKNGNNGNKEDLLSEIDDLCLDSEPDDSDDD